MSVPRLVQLDSVAAIRGRAAAWDDLWQRSEVVLPVGRAALVAQWIETVSPRASVHALAVEQDGQFIAALPLVGGCVKRLLPAGRLPANNWSWAGDLLVDPSADLESAMDLLAAAVGRLPWPLVWMEGVALESARWQAFVAALERAGLPCDGNERFRVGQIKIGDDWDAYKATLSGNHRHQMRRMAGRAKKEGGTTLVVLRDLRPDQVESLLRRGFEVECRSWKGAEGTAVLKSPAVFGFYCRQARQLAEWGQLQLTYLELADRAIAFEYGWNAKGVYCSPKVGYDEEFRRLTPGQLLRYELIERFFADPEQRLFDFGGPLADATAKWTTRTYSIGRLVVGTQRRGGRALIGLMRGYWGWKRKLRNDGRRIRSDAAETEACDSELPPVSA